MNKDLVSIIMLSRNDSKYVERSVKSVLNQTYQNWELLIIDDASDDDTLALLLKLRGTDSRFRICQSIYKRGSTASINSALKDANGRWVAFIGADTIWEADKLERQTAFMNEKNVVLVILNLHSETKS